MNYQNNSEKSQTLAGVTRLKSMDTGDVVAEMLAKPITHELCDSGSFYGYNYQRNASRDFAQEPVFHAFDPEDNPPSLIQSLYWFICRNTAYDHGMTRKFYRFAYSKNMMDRDISECMEEFARKRNNYEATESTSVTDTTYNHETTLDQGFLYAAFMPEAEVEYVIISVHNGCDIRGGYTMPRVFQITEGNNFWSSLSQIYCQCACGSVETDDCGSEWYGDDDLGEEHKNGWPKRWKPDGKNVHCTHCNGAVEMS